MFTVNCKIDTSQRMKAPTKTKKSKSKNSEHSEDSQEETYYPVQCSACDTHVAMFDNDEIFHFFNVVTSH